MVYTSQCCCYPVEDVVITAGQSSRQPYASPKQPCIPNQALTLELDAPAHVWQSDMAESARLLPHQDPDVVWLQVTVRTPTLVKPLQCLQPHQYG